LLFKQIDQKEAAGMPNHMMAVPALIYFEKVFRQQILFFTKIAMVFPETMGLRNHWSQLRATKAN